jgi:hypothetical protein
MLREKLLELGFEEGDGKEGETIVLFGFRSLLPKPEDPPAKISRRVR